MNEKRQAFEA